MREETIGFKVTLRVEILTRRSQEVGREGDAHWTHTGVLKDGRFQGRGWHSITPPPVKLGGGV